MYVFLYFLFFPSCFPPLSRAGPGIRRREEGGGGGGGGGGGVEGGKGGRGVTCVGESELEKIERGVLLTPFVRYFDQRARRHMTQSLVVKKSVTHAPHGNDVHAPTRASTRRLRTSIKHMRIHLCEKTDRPCKSVGSERRPQRASLRSWAIQRSWQT